jgi:hypothetical protein
VPDLRTVDEAANELTLAELEREIARETEAIADLGRRSRVLEAEAAGWYSRSASRPVQEWTQFDRLLSVLGFLLGFPAAVTVGAIICILGCIL